MSKTFHVLAPELHWRTYIVEAESIEAVTALPESEIMELKDTGEDYGHTISQDVVAWEIYDTEGNLLNIMTGD